MAILFTEGFDNLGVSDGLTYGKWQEALSSAFGVGGGNAGTRSLVTGRFGQGSALHLFASGGSLGSGASYNTYNLGGDVATLFIGFAMKENQQQGGAAGFLWLFDNAFGTEQVHLELASGNFIVISRNGTTLATSGTPITLNAWAWIELAVFISATAGWAEVRLNSNLVASYYGTGTSRATANGNTKTTSLASVRYVRHGVNTGNSATGERTFDDFVANDNTGTANNDFPGDVRVIGLLPNAVGAHSDFTRTGGTTAGNYTAVNENPVDGDTSYVAGGTVGNTDTYKYAALPSSANAVKAVASYLIARTDDAGSRSITTRIRSNAAEADAPSPIALTASYGTGRQIMETNPVTAANWTVADVNAVEAGPKVTA